MTPPAGVLARTARRCPDRVAVQFGDVALTYAELDRAVDELAAELAGRGLEQGDRMLLLAGNSDAFVVAVYAGLRLDAIVVPINPRSAPTEIDYLVTDTGARLLLFGPEVADGVRAWHSLPDRTGDAEPLALGTVGHVTMLRRVKAGPFTLDSAISLDILNDAATGHGIAQYMLPLTAGLDDIPALSVSPDEALALRQGKMLIGKPHTGLLLAMLGETPIALVESSGPDIRVVRGFNL